MGETWAIETEHLTKVYGSGNTEVVALWEAGIRVGHGEIVALLGPSGSGKSTFLTAVGLINPPTSGRIFIDGRLVVDGPRALTDLRKFRRQHIGYVFPKSNLVAFLCAIRERADRP
jgi:putative ABC transport system ATP-binding protein